MPERHNHGKNNIGTIRIQLFCQGIHFAGVRRFGEAQASFRGLGMLLIAKGLRPHDILAKDSIRLFLGQLH